MPADVVGIHKGLTLGMHSQRAHPIFEIHTFLLGRSVNARWKADDPLGADSGFTAHPKNEENLTQVRNGPAHAPMMFDIGNEDLIGFHPIVRRGEKE